MEGSFKGLTRGAWTPEEDNLLKECIDKYGEGKWHLIPLRTGLNRCRKSCRLRWVNYLNTDIKRGEFSSDEVDLLLRLHKLLGNRWTLIAGRLPGRTANDVKNYWKTNLAKKQESYSMNKMRKREMTSSATTPAEKNNVTTLRPLSFSNNNGCSGLTGHLEVGLDDVGTKDGGITCNKEDEKYEFLDTLMDGGPMWWESLLEESHEADVVCPAASTTDEADNSLINSMSSTFSLISFGICSMQIVKRLIRLFFRFDLNCLKVYRSQFDIGIKSHIRT